MENEKLQILKMVQEGKVSPEEASKLLQAVGEKPAAPISTDSSRWMRIKVWEEGKQKVNVNLPMALVEAALSMGLKFVPEEQLKGVDIDMLIQAVRSGFVGKLIEVDDEDTKVEISVE